MLLVGDRTMSRIGHVMAHTRGPHVARDALALREDLDGGRSQTAIHFALDQLVGDGVVVLQERHVVVYIGARPSSTAQTHTVASAAAAEPAGRPPYHPEGRSKIERYFRSVREQFLANLDHSRPRTLDELSDRLRAWLEHAYHRTEHNALGTTPLLRWQRDIDHIRQLPPATDLRRLFFHRLQRLVRRDCTFLTSSRFYEAPPHLARHIIEVRFDPLDAATVEIYVQGTRQGMARPVDPIVNSQVPAVRPRPPEAPVSTGSNFLEMLTKQHKKEEPS
jgi:hypothetical protein